MTSDPRKLALAVLNTLDEGRGTLDQALESPPVTGSDLSPRDRALFNALVFGVLRWRGRLDWIVAHFAKSGLRKIRPEVLNILRLGLFQMLHTDRIPVSAAVNTSVNLARDLKAPRLAGFVNGLLRNAARHHGQVPFPDPARDPVAALAARKSFPPWLVARWLERFGLEQTGRLCDAVNQIPALTVRANTLKTTRAQLAAALRTDADQVAVSQRTPEALSLVGLKTPVARLQPFLDGWFQVQDEAAQLIGHLLDPQPGETVLDACAGLGGKSGHLAQLMADRGQLTAVDSQADKLERLRSDMQRLGVTIVDTAVRDLERPPDPAQHAAYDRVLLDAPCSGLGVLRRNPDSKWVLSKTNLAYYNERQLRLLKHAAPLVKPGGTLVYAVCSFEPEENEAVVEAFLKARPDFRPARPIVESVAGGAGGYFKTRPDTDDMDGFFGARLQRIAS